MLKKIFGGVVLLVGLAIIPALLYAASSELSIPEKNTSDNLTFWIIIMVIFAPITAGFCLFGYYSIQGEYAVIDRGGNPE